MKKFLSIFISTALVVSGYAQTRNVLVGTNNAVVQPTNFWSADASNARAGLGLGTAATNPASAFQPASSVLSNLVSGGSLTFTNITVGISNVTGLQSDLDGKLGTNPTLQISNINALQTALDGKLSGTFPIAISNVSGLQTSLDGKLSTNPTLSISNISGLQTNLDSKISITGNAANLTNFPASLLRTTGDASGLTNFPTLNQATTGTASNVTGIVAVVNGGTGTNSVIGARQNLGLVWMGLTNTNAETFRGGLGATTVGSSIFTLANPSSIRFIRVNSDNTVSALSDSDFRTAIGIGTAATNPSSVFQPSSTVLSNLASGNAVNLTNLRATNVVGAIAISNGGSGATTAGGARTNFGLGATNNVAFGSVAISGGDLQFSNDSIYWAGSVRYSPEDQLFFGTITIEDGAVNFGGTNIAANKAATRANLGLGNISTNTFQTTNTAVYINTNIVATNGKLITTNIESSYIEAYNFFVVDGTNGITFETTSIAAISRTNFGLPWSGLTNTNALTFRSALELGTTNTLTIAGVTAQNLTITAGGGITLQSTLTNAASFRTNIGLPLAALTNTNNTNFLAAFFGANTNPVLVNTNGEVVSPTNFWQVSPANTRVQLVQPVVNATNTATNARTLYLYSLAISTTGVTNTIQLPTNGGTLLGDVATVIHEGPTNSITAVRQVGSGTNIITLNQFQEAVQFIRESGGWRVADNISQVEPLYFSGTNAAIHAASSRTNLGLGGSDDVLFSSVSAGQFEAGSGTNTVSVEGTGIVFGGNSSATTRTNLGLPLAALTNTSVTNFQKAIFYTNTAPSNIGGNLGTIAAWIEIVASNGVTYKIPAYTNVP